MANKRTRRRLAQRRGKHRSTDKAVQAALSDWEVQPEVKRVILGRARGQRHRYAPGTLRIQQQHYDSEGRCMSLKGVVYTHNGLRDVFILLR